MKPLSRILTLLALLALPAFAPAQSAPAEAAPAVTAPATPAAASIEQRVGDLEAYVNNTAPKAGDDKVVGSATSAVQPRSRSL